MNKCTAQPILRKEKLNAKTGFAPIAIQFFINGIKKVISLNIYIQTGHWDQNKRRVTASSYQKEFNLVIDKALSKANKIFVDYYLMERELTPDKFIAEFTDSENRLDFIKFYETELERRYNYKIISYGTYKIQKSTLNKLKQYQPQIMFSELTSEFIEKFDAWNRNHIAQVCKSRGKKQKMDSINTRARTNANLRTYINLAVEKIGVKIKSPFTTIKIKQVNAVRVILEVDEIQRLNDLFHNDSLPYTTKLTLARFLFACFTSIRISDARRLFEIKMINNSIEFIPEKTKNIGKHLSIPLNNTARAYYDFIKANDFYRVGDQETNRQLKVIAVLANINKIITFHTARHTFATQFIANGGDITVLKDILGHSDIRTSMIYVNMVNGQKQKQIRMMDGILSN